LSFLAVFFSGGAVPFSMIHREFVLRASPGSAILPTFPPRYVSHQRNPHSLLFLRGAFFPPFFLASDGPSSDEDIARFSFGLRRLIHKTFLLSRQADAGHYLTFSCLAHSVPRPSFPLHPFLPQLYSSGDGISFFSFHHRSISPLKFGR